ncbi:MAG: AlpA family transcriptional regulator [Methyloceanibacter sp.]
MEKRGEFPRRIALTAKPNGRHGWAEDEVDAWPSDLVARRDASTNGGLRDGRHGDVRQRAENRGSSRGREF